MANMYVYSHHIPMSLPNDGTAYDQWEGLALPTDEDRDREERRIEQQIEEDWARIRDERYGRL